MYNIPGLTKTLQLTSYTACAILTGGITNWNIPQIAAINPGVSLPNLAIRPGDGERPRRNHFVLQEWCIDEQPALWKAFANYENSQIRQCRGSSRRPRPNPSGRRCPTGSTQTRPRPYRPTSPPTPVRWGRCSSNTATDAGFGTGNPAKGVASVLNASGDYAQPTPVDVASALAYATQLPNGTHQLNFGGAGPHVYNPSTYSYLLTPTAGWQASKGAVMSGFVNYVLDARTGEIAQFRVREPRAVTGALRYRCSDRRRTRCGQGHGGRASWLRLRGLTPSEVAAGQTTPTCGVTDATAPIPPASGVAGVSGHSTAAGGAQTAGSSGAGARTAAATALAVSVVSVVPAPECPCPDRRLWHSPVAILFRSFLLEDCCWPPDGPPVAAC